jgi:type II secretory pathway pseudopilin PulG
MVTTSTRRCKPSEEGYILVVVMFMLALLVLSLAVAVPVVRKDIQRDREIETMRRGKQYVRAIKLYYKTFHAYPPSVDALVMTNNIRFLRKKYIDPTTGKDEWKIIRFGQNKTQTLGFFGQPIGGAALAGTGPGSTGPNPSLGMFNSPPNSSPVSGSTGSGSPVNTSGAPADPNAPNGAANPSGATLAGPSGGGTTSTDPNAPSGSSTPGTSTGLTGQTFGGGPIIGVSPNSPKQSILLYKKKNHYNEWEFFYDPLADQMMQGGMPGGNIGNVGLTPTPNPTPTPTPTPPAPQPPQ